MPHETVIHRIDAELGTGRAVAPVPSDLAVDGIDELLNIFVAYTITEGSDYFTDILGRSPGWTYLVRADGSAWQMRTGPELFTVADGAGDEAADVTVSGRLRPCCDGSGTARIPTAGVRQPLKAAKRRLTSCAGALS